MGVRSSNAEDVRTEGEWGLGRVFSVGDVAFWCTAAMLMTLLGYCIKFMRFNEGVNNCNSKILNITFTRPVRMAVETATLLEICDRHLVTLLAEHQTRDS